MGSNGGDLPKLLFVYFGQRSRFVQGRLCYPSSLQVTACTILANQWGLWAVDCTFLVEVN